MRSKYTGNVTVEFEIEAPTQGMADAAAMQRFDRIRIEDMEETGSELIRIDPYEEISRYGM